ncbi:uncharacterized protein BP5553_09741 [Venustampulla echinocandica]|uniref:CFEM domain-containing protein n=1 Tax=Venustampulla echinocandica TaxID=2656787 RepID=A0A370TBV3_9HELO|nr:uncharacterized protein BP5553_09741 [Venustampulla echinocandica]RDL31532.1 hypothetical protein BP5553_09741 [Venustampulla echinocandica]
MKTTSFALVVAAAASIVSAQDLSGEPACAIPCLTSAISKVGCGLTDQACQCGTGMAPIQTAVTPCLISNCSPADLIIAASVGSKLCADYSATATGGAASGSGTGSATASGSGSGARTETAVRTSAPAPLSTGTGSSPGTGGKNGTTGGLSTSAKPTPGGPSPSSSSSAGAAPTLIAGIGSLVGLVAGVVAAL